MYLKAMSMSSSWTKTSQRDMMAFPKRPTAQLNKLWRLFKLVIAGRLSTRTAVSQKKKLRYLEIRTYLFIFIFLSPQFTQNRHCCIIFSSRIEKTFLLRKHFYLIYLRTFWFSRRLCFDSFWRAPRNILVSFGTGSRFRPSRCHATHDY